MTTIAGPEARQLARLRDREPNTIDTRSPTDVIVDREGNHVFVGVGLEFLRDDTSIQIAFDDCGNLIPVLKLYPTMALRLARELLAAVEEARSSWS